MRAYKLFRLKKSGKITSLFINKLKDLPLNIWMEVFAYPTEGFQVRPGWHCMSKKSAPHLSKKNRIWAEIEIKDFEVLNRPKNQGGKWYLAKWIRIKKLIGVVSKINN